VEEYVNTGRDKNVVDPDQHKIFTRRKERLETIRRQSKSTRQTIVPVKFPSDGWSTRLQRMPHFTRAEMDLHISSSGKSIDPKSKGNSVPTNMQKAKICLNDEYLKDVLAASDDKYSCVKSLCHQSFRKNEHPHNLRIALDFLTGEVKS
jgi:hypothetical protein